MQGRALPPPLFSITPASRRRASTFWWHCVQNTCARARTVSGRRGREEQLWAYEDTPKRVGFDDLEQDHRLPGTEPVATGLAAAMHSWARGATLDRVLDEADLAAGDFVRWTKQTIDLLDQLSLVAAPPVAATARAALDAVRRGIVVYGSP